MHLQPVKRCRSCSFRTAHPAAAIKSRHITYEKQRTPADHLPACTSCLYIQPLKSDQFLAFQDPTMEPQMALHTLLVHDELSGTYHMHQNDQQVLTDQCLLLLHIYSAQHPKS